jgi:hypothetical protein
MRSTIVIRGIGGGSVIISGITEGWDDAADERDPEVAADLTDRADPEAAVDLADPGAIVD